MYPPYPTHDRQVMLHPFSIFTCDISPDLSHVYNDVFNNIVEDI